MYVNRYVNNVLQLVTYPREVKFRSIQRLKFGLRLHFDHGASTEHDFALTFWTRLNLKHTGVCRGDLEFKLPTEHKKLETVLRHSNLCLCFSFCFLYTAYRLLQFHLVNKI